MIKRLHKIRLFIKRNIVASVLYLFVIFMLINFLIVPIYYWFLEKFGIINTMIAAIVVVSILSVAINFMYFRDQRIREDIKANPITESLQERYKGLIVSISLISEPKEQIKEAIDNIRDEYLFSWDDVPGKDSEKLLRFLKDDCAESWSEYAEIKKSADDKIILITNGNKSVKIVIDKEVGSGYLQLSDGYIYNLLLKEEMIEQKIYVIDKGLYRIYQVRGIGQTFRAIKHHCGELIECWMLCSGDVEDSKELVEHFTKKFSKKTVQIEPIPLDNTNNIEEIFEKINTVYAEKIRAIGLEETDVIADLTGGTVIMSCAMIFACLSVKRDLEYVEQKTYNLKKIEENVSELIHKR